MAMETHRPCARGEKKKLRSLPESLAKGKHASTRVHRKPPQRILKSLKTASTREKPENYARMRPVSSPDLRAHYIFFLDQKRPKCGKKFHHRKPREYVQTRRTRSRENRAISVFDPNRTGKKREREEMREHLQFTHHFCLSKICFFFCFLLRVKSVKKRETRERDEKNRKKIWAVWAFSSASSQIKI